MELQVEELAGGVTRALLQGRFDTTGAIAVELPINTLATERRALVVDLSNVSFMSSYGIRVLLRAAKIAKGKESRFLIVCPDSPVCKVLNTAGTSDVIPVYPTLATATAAIG